MNTEDVNRRFEALVDEFLNLAMSKTTQGNQGEHGMNTQDFNRRFDALVDELKDVVAEAKVLGGLRPDALPHQLGDE